MTDWWGAEFRLSPRAAGNYPRTIWNSVFGVSSNQSHIGHKFGIGGKAEIAANIVSSLDQGSGAPPHPDLTDCLAAAPLKGGKRNTEKQQSAEGKKGGSTQPQLQN